MQLLYLFEKIRNPVLDAIFSFITLFGEETAFLAIAILFFWCVNKRHGYFIMITGFIGTIVNQIMKLAFKVPRPWDIDKSFTIVESAREGATGYSFPSGHTQSAVGTFGAVFAKVSNKIIKWGAFAIAVLVPISRMYLGVHTPWDVLAAASIAVMLLVVLEPIFSDEKKFDKCMPFIIGFVTLLEIGFFLFAVVFSGNSADVNVVSAGKNARTFLGCTLALIPVYFLERKFVKFETRAKWYSQIIKLVLGLGFVILIKEGLRYPLELMLGGANERILRYFLIVIFAGLIWPLTFKWFSVLEIPMLDRFGAWVVSPFSKKKNEGDTENSSAAEEKPVKKVNPARINNEEKKPFRWFWQKKKPDEKKRRSRKKKKPGKRR